MDERYMERFETLREKLFEFIEYSLKVDGHCKGYEGRFAIEYLFPDYFHREDDPTFNIKLDCYLIGPTRHYSWEGALFGDTLRRAEQAIYKWIDEGYRFYKEEFAVREEA